MSCISPAILKRHCIEYEGLCGLPVPHTQILRLRGCLSKEEKYHLIDLYRIALAMRPNMKCYTCLSQSKKVVTEKFLDGAIKENDPILINFFILNGGCYIQAPSVDINRRISTAIAILFEKSKLLCQVDFKPSELFREILVLKAKLDNLTELHTMAIAYRNKPKPIK